MISPRSLARIFVLAVLLFVAGSHTASATHFRYGHFHWEKVLDPALPPNLAKVNVTFEAGYRWHYAFVSTGAQPPIGATLANDVFLTVTPSGGSPVNFS